MSKEERNHGYHDGRREADWQNNSNFVQQIIRDIGYSPKNSTSEDYERGFREGLEDGKRK